MRIWLASLILASAAAPARADFVTDWVTFGDQLEEALPSAAPGSPTTFGKHAYDASQLALAMFEALNAIDPRYASMVGMPRADKGASQEAAAATAAYRVLKTCLPDAPPSLDDSYAIAMSEIVDATAREKGRFVGEAAAKLALAQGGVDPAIAQVPYRPMTSPGVWTATALPVIEPVMGAFKPWGMPRIDSVRPGPPPALTSDIWARDAAEVKRLGAKDSKERTPIQTIFARYRMRPDLKPTLAWIADSKGRTPVQNARMYALLAMVDVDAAIAIGDAKLHYNFWRPVTAIRNADTDGNDATETDAAWVPYLNTPNHPEYPCGHCIGASADAAIIAAEGVLPPDGVRFRTLVTDAIVEKVPTLDAYVDTVSMSRIYGGVHYRFSNVVGQDMGRKVAAMLLAKRMRPITR